MTKRSPGIRQRSPGTWQITVYTQRIDAEGRYQRVIETLRGTKRQAEQRRAELMADIAAGRYQKPVRETVESFFTRWLAGSSKLAPQSKRKYEIVIRRHVIPHIGTVLLRQVDAGHILLLHARWRESGLTDVSIYDYHTLVQSVLGQAKRWKLITDNPATEVEKPRQVARHIIVLDNDQLQKLITATDQHKFWIAYRILIHTGMRVGEVLGLRWKDVDLDGRELSIAQQYTVSKSFSLPKGNKSPRRVNIDSQLVAMLKAWKSIQNAFRLSAGSKWANLDLVFCDEVGRPYNHFKLFYYFRHIVKETGLPEGFRLHDLRHNHASIMIAQGTDLKVIQERLGHSSPAFTLSVYGHQMPGRQKEAAQRFADSLDSKSPDQKSSEIPG